MEYRVLTTLFNHLVGASEQRGLRLPLTRALPGHALTGSSPARHSSRSGPHHVARLIDGVQKNDSFQGQMPKKTEL